MDFLNAKVMNKNEVLLQVVNENDLVTFIDNAIKEILVVKDVSKFFYKEMFDILLRDIILSKVEVLELKTNYPYIVKLTLSGNLNVYNLVNLQNEQLGSGYTISKTLQF